MKKLGMILVSVALLSGCARLSDFNTDNSRTQKEQKEDQTPATMTCTSDKNDTLTFEAKGDQIQNMTQVFTMSFADLGIREDLDAQSIQDKINQSLQSLYDLKGVEATGKIVEDHVEITLHVNYEIANDKELVEAGLLQEGERDSEHISLKQTRKSQEASGYTCTVE